MRKTSKWEDANGMKTLQAAKLKKICKLKTVECTLPQSAIKGLADVAPSRARPRKERKNRGRRRREDNWKTFTWRLRQRRWRRGKREDWGRHASQRPSVRSGQCLAKLTNGKCRPNARYSFCLSVSFSACCKGFGKTERDRRPSISF